MLVELIDFLTCAKARKGPKGKRSSKSFRGL